MITLNPIAPEIFYQHFYGCPRFCWFKNATVHDLQNVKIYDFVRDEIAVRFRFMLRDFINVKLDKQLGALMDYKPPSQRVVKRWA
jgi:hypothetical protein